MNSRRKLRPKPIGESKIFSTPLKAKQENTDEFMVSLASNGDPKFEAEKEEEFIGDFEDTECQTFRSEGPLLTGEFVKEADLFLENSAKKSDDYDFSDIEDDEIPDIASSGSECDSSEGEYGETDEEDFAEFGKNIFVSGPRDWCKVNQREPIAPPYPRFPFTARPAVNYVHNKDKGVLQYFNLFFDDELVEGIATETNKYATQCIATAPANQRPLLQERWAPTTSSEIRVYLAIILAQSLIRKHDQKQYWTKDTILSTPFFAQTMAQTRYLKLKQYMHFADNSQFDPQTHPNPKLRKVWPIFKNLSEKFQNVYTPEQDLTIDESRMLYQGRLGYAKYIPLRPERCGIKTFLLCESKSGYVWRLIIYTGKGTTILHEDYTNLPMPSQIVMTLIRPLLNLGYCLTTDHVYTSPQLADLLITFKTDSYGTVNPNQKEMPKELRTSKLKRGEVMAFTRGKVMALKWKDRKDITLLSTVHNSEMVEVIKMGEKFLKPKVVVAYNGTMGGVNIVDQDPTDYRHPRKRTKKYYRQIFFHLLDLALWNAYIIYTKTEGGRLTPLKFRHTLIGELVSKYWNEEERTPIARASNELIPHRLSGKHFPEFIPASAKKIHHQKQCVMCSRFRDPVTGKRIRRDTRFQCDNCNVALCVAGCFKVYHSEPDL